MQFETIHLFFYKTFCIREMQSHSTDTLSSKHNRIEIQEGYIFNNKLKFQYFIEFLIIWISDKNKA